MWWCAHLVWGGGLNQTFFISRGRENTDIAFRVAYKLLLQCMVSVVTLMLEMLIIVCYYQVVFRGGEGALQVLPPLVDVIPEARLNLVSDFRYMHFKARCHPECIVRISHS